MRSLPGPVASQTSSARPGWANLGGVSTSEAAVVLGAGYAGLRVAHEIRRKSRRQIPVVLVDRHPFSVLRTELYRVADLAGVERDRAEWVVPLSDIETRKGIEFREGEVESVDFVAKQVGLRDGQIAFGQLVIALGSEVAYYGVPGAKEHTYQVYRLGEAIRLAEALKALESRFVHQGRPESPHIVVVGGGSTGTEVAADIATADWSKVTGTPAPRPRVTLVCGELPLLVGFSEGLIFHARRLLGKAKVTLNEGVNVTSVSGNEIHLRDGTVLQSDLCVWAAGIQATALVRGLNVPHGHGGRIAVRPTLEVPDHPGVFSLGDSADVVDPATGLAIPAMAQVAIREAPIVAANVVARRTNQPLLPFVYRQRGSIVAVGGGQAAGEVRRITIWGRPAALLKAAVQQDVRIAQRQRIRPPGV